MRWLIFKAFLSPNPRIGVHVAIPVWTVHNFSEIKALLRKVPMTVICRSSEFPWEIEKILWTENLLEAAKLYQVLPPTKSTVLLWIAHYKR